MFKKKTAIFIWLLLILVSSQVWAKAESHRIERTSVSGMAVFAQKTDSKRIEVVLLLKSGSGLDPQGRKGTSFVANQFVFQLLFYHKMKLGWADADIETYPDYTIIKIETSSRKVKPTLTVIKNLLTGPLYFYDYELVTDLKNWVTTELKATPAIVRSYFDLNREFYGVDHPYNNDLDPDSFNSISGNDVFGWYRQTYRPGNAILSISGDFKESLSYFKKFFENMPGGVIDNRLLVKPVVLEKTRQLEAVDPNGRAASISIGFPAPRMNDPEYPAFRIIVYYLEEYQHYFEELRVKEGLIYAGFVIYNYLEKPKAPNIVFLTMTEPQKLSAVEERTIAVVRKLIDAGLEPEELKSVIKAMKTRDSVEKNDGKGMAVDNALGYYLETQLVYDEKLWSKLEQVTTEDIRNAAAKYFQNYIRVAYLPKG